MKETTTNTREIILDILEHTNYNDLRWERFNYCQAQYSNEFYNEEYNVKVRLFCSYCTIVGVVIDDVFYELGKYSRTTSKQIGQWWGHYNRKLFEDWRIVNRVQYFTGGVRY